MLSNLTNSQLLLSGVLLALLQGLAALPWLWAIDPPAFRRGVRSISTLSYSLIALIVGGVALTLFMGAFGESDALRGYGRIFAAVFHLQLLVDFFILAPMLLILIAPKTGAVALAAYREGWRQPMFWIITLLAVFVMVFSIFLPYYTFSEDYKMMKMIAFDIVMLSAALFGVLAASLSISEEIEGRTAITVMSKPINRRSFLVGKYLGILLASGSMSLILAWCLNWTLLYSLDQDPINKQTDSFAEQAKAVIGPAMTGLFRTPQTVTFLDGVANWVSDTVAHSPGIAIGFGQVMILVAIATSLATRLAFVLNVLITLVVYFLGHLAPVVLKATDRGGDGTFVPLVRFFGQLFDTLLPALEFFTMNTAVVRELPLNLWQFFTYVVVVLGYSLIYTTIALLVGLLLFENRDLA